MLPEDDPECLFFGDVVGTAGTTIEGRLFDSPRPMMFGSGAPGYGGCGVEAGSFVMDSIFEVMEGH